MRFPDLIDFCIIAEEESGLMGNAPELFRKALTDYFFREEVAASKSLGPFFDKMEMPAFLGAYPSLYEVDIEELRGYVDSETINSSLCGRIFLSAPYLKSFYPHQPPSFNQISPDVRAEVLNRIKDTNREIMESFEKMKADIVSDKNRLIISLVARVIKNVHGITEFPLNKLERKAQEVIQGIIPSSNEIYTASTRQTAELTDDARVRDLVKLFFAIKKYQDVADITGHYRKELERYRKRTLRARG